MFQETPTSYVGQLPGQSRKLYKNCLLHNRDRNYPHGFSRWNQGAQSRCRPSNAMNRLELIRKHLRKPFTQSSKIIGASSRLSCRAAVDFKRELFGPHSLRHRKNRTPNVEGRVAQILRIWRKSEWFSFGEIKSVKMMGHQNEQKELFGYQTETYAINRRIHAGFLWGTTGSRALPPEPTRSSPSPTEFMVPVPPNQSLWRIGLTVEFNVRLPERIHVAWKIRDANMLKMGQFINNSSEAIWVESPVITNLITIPPVAPGNSNGSRESRQL